MNQEIKAVEEVNNKIIKINNLLNEITYIFINHIRYKRDKYIIYGFYDKIILKFGEIDNIINDIIKYMDIYVSKVGLYKGSNLYNIIYNYLYIKDDIKYNFMKIKGFTFFNCECCDKDLNHRNRHQHTKTAKYKTNLNNKVFNLLLLNE
jgi:hypothetical protein